MQHAIRFQHNEDSELPSLADVMSCKPGKEAITARSAYHYLVNLDEFPEMLPLAYHLVANAIEASKNSPSIFPAKFHDEKTYVESFASLPGHLATLAQSFSDKSFRIDGITGNSIQDKNQFLAHRLAPTMLVAGSWIQNLSRVATAHTTVAGKLNKVYSLQTMAYAAADVQHTGRIGSDILNLFTTFHESRLSRTYSLCESTEDYAFEFPLLLLGIGQFPREFLPELLGLNLAWHNLGVHAFVEKITLENFLGSSLANESLDKLEQRNKMMAALSQEAIEIFCNEQDSVNQPDVRRRILYGVDMFARAWTLWINNVKTSLARGDTNPETGMLELIRHKGPCALGYHRDKQLGPHKIDDLLDSKKFDPAEVLVHLANSPYIVPGDAANSPFTTRLVEFGGPMVGVFTNEELDVIRSWINSLDKNKNIPVKKSSASPPKNIGAHSLWERTKFLDESRREYANRPCSLRELYYKLVNIEYFPDVLPIAEQFLVDRLNRTRSTLTTGERPLPATHYSHEILEQWVYNKHRQQVDAYQPLAGKPKVSKEIFIEATAGLAPLLLIDGGWLQGATHVNTLYTPVGLKLYRIFLEEIGEGAAELHHANIYRELLQAMGVEFPDVTDLDFAFSDRFQDAAFEVPVLWLSLSCFTRYYFPELLGINLAVELAGIGAGYMEAHDTLKYYGFPTTFVDYHNSSDNVSAGHAAWALETIKIYMNEVAAREGQHNLDTHWHRIWAGMRLTLPASSDFYWNPASSGIFR